MSTAERRQRNDIVPMFTTIYRRFDLCSPLCREDRSSQFTKLLAQLCLGKWTLEVSAVAIARMGCTTTVA